MVKKETRSGICHAINRHAKGNNKYMKKYDKNIESSYLMYLDANNLCGWAMSQKLPVDGFKWIKKLSEFNEDFSCAHKSFKKSIKSWINTKKST